MSQSSVMFKHEGNLNIVSVFLAEDIALEHMVHVADSLHVIVQIQNSGIYYRELCGQTSSETPS